MGKLADTIKDLKEEPAYVRVINLSDQGVNDDDMEDLCDALEGSKIIRLHLRNNKVGERGAKALRNLLHGLPTLRMVELKGNSGIPDKLLEEITGLVSDNEARHREGAKGFSSGAGRPAPRDRRARSRSDSRDRRRRRDDSGSADRRRRRNSSEDRSDRRQR
eukprot:TRINITY_DN243_c1_g1_i1.p1 TRINITY_DN243_c1_g1~~TRINITY_DN243_c1_g1_i1.p1  ORF type:complete len:190 (+),score=69.41 TRINITY_DN243_c1_g1_i1:85-570(+)